jgi:predicted alpha/beta hydrolase family esterase
MSKQVLFVQGGSEGTHDAWDSKLVDSLERGLGAEYHIRYPTMPNEADPRYAAWRAALEHEFAELEDGALLVGHSIGATFLINALAELGPKRKFGGVFLLAAPFLGEGGWPSDEITTRPDLGIDLPRDLPVFLYHGEVDTIVPFSHADLYAEAIPQAHVRCLPGHDHQINNDLTQVADDIRRTCAGS